MKGKTAAGAGVKSGLSHTAPIQGGKSNAGKAPEGNQLPRHKKEQCSAKGGSFEIC